MNIAHAGLAGRIILLGIERIIVKRLGTKQDPVASTFLLFFIGAISVAPWCFNQQVDNWNFLYPMAIASIIYSMAFILYVSSLSQGDASLVTPLYNFNIFFLAIGASWFLTEPLTATKVAGLGFLLVGASFLIGESSFSRSLSSLTTNGPCRQMIGASFLIAIGRIVDKAHIGELNPYIYALFLYLSISFWVGLYLLFTGRAGEISKVFKCRPALAITCGIGNGYSYICLLWALTSYNVSVVEPLSMLSVLVTLFLSKVYLGETLGHRIYGAMIMIGGAILIC